MGKQKFRIVHYLNKRLKPSYVNGIAEYPVYIRVTYERKNERIKSDWIIHNCSEFDFQNNKNILELIEYERDIISDILKENKDETFNLSARLGHSKKFVSDIYLNNMFEKNEIKNQIIDFINIKTGISNEILNPFFNIELLPKQWKELLEKDIFTNETKEKIKYLYLLLMFEKEHYPPLPNETYGLKAGCFFVYYEWKNKNKENEFLQYAKKHNILSKSTLINITKELNKYLKIINTSDF